MDPKYVIVRGVSAEPNRGVVYWSGKRVFLSAYDHEHHNVMKHIRLFNSKYEAETEWARSGFDIDDESYYISRATGTAEYSIMELDDMFIRWPFTLINSVMKS